MCGEVDWRSMDGCVRAMDGDGWVVDGCVDGWVVGCRWMVTRWWRTCVVVVCAVERRGGEVTRLEPQDLCNCGTRLVPLL
jgi:hypothetical protein